MNLPKNLSLFAKGRQRISVKIFIISSITPFQCVAVLRFRSPWPHKQCRDETTDHHWYASTHPRYNSHWRTPGSSCSAISWFCCGVFKCFSRINFCLLNGYTAHISAKNSVWIEFKYQTQLFISQLISPSAFCSRQRWRPLPLIISPDSKLYELQIFSYFRKVNAKPWVQFWGLASWS